MKYLLVLLLSSPVLAFDGPYFTGPFSTHPDIQISAGGLFSSRAKPVSGFTNMALAYHAADPDNSLIAKRYQAWLPPESWTLASLGIGGGSGNYNIGPGLQFNLANYFQAYASEIAGFFGPTGQRISMAIAPTASGLSLTAGPQWYCPIVQNGTVEKFNQLRLLPGWYVGAAYSKRF